MPRSRRRRVNDRRREAEQRLAARAVLEKARLEEREKLGRYVKSVLRTRAGEVVQSHDGHRYQVQEDGSLRRIESRGGTP
jgi:hypothetical protein